MSEQQETNRRGFLTKAIEVTSAVPLMGLAANNFYHQSSYQNMDFSDAKLYNSPLAPADKLSTFFNGLSAFSNAANHLYDQYKDEYHKSRLVPYTYSDGKGRVKMGLRTEYYWDEPNGLPGHGEISSMASFANHLSSKYHELTSQTHVDIEKLKDISIRTLNGDKRSEQILTAFVYGGEVALLLSYEELIAHCSKDYGETVAEEVDESMSASQHTRRSIFKVAAAVAGGFVAAGISSSISDRLSRGKEILEEEIQATKTIKNTTQAQAIKHFIGSSPQDMYYTLQTYTSVSQSAISNPNLRQQNVRNAFVNLQYSAQNAAGNLEIILNDDKECDKLAYVCRCATATAKLNSANSADETLAHTSHLLESLGVGAALAVIVGAGEYANRKLK